MPALPPYIPARDTDLNAWLGNFSTLLTASPTTYGQTSGVAAAVAAAVAAWDAAYAPVLSPSTKTAAAVAAKNSARVTVLANVRPVAQQVSLNPAVLTANKTAIGVNPRTSTPTPITPPLTVPILTVQGASNLQLILRYRDSAASVSVKAKPYGTAFCKVVYLVSPTPITDPSQLTTSIVLSKSPGVVTFAAGQVGQQCYLAGRWLLRNGGQSGYGPIVSFTVAAGS